MSGTARTSWKETKKEKWLGLAKTIWKCFQASGVNMTCIYCRLNETCNLLSFEEVVVKRVHVNVNSCGCSREETCPLPGKDGINVNRTLDRWLRGDKSMLHSPSVVLSIEQEVCANNGNANCHDAEDNQNQHHKTVHIVNFVGPEGGEDKVPETQKPTWSHLLPTPPNYTCVEVR